MTSTSSLSAWGSCTSESVQIDRMYLRGGFGASCAQRSGRVSYPCVMRPIVKGKDPPPWAKHRRNRGCLSSTPPIVTAHIATVVSVGIPMKIRASG